MFEYDEEKLKETMDLYLKNEGWKEAYEKAPSDACRDFFKMTFYRSNNDEPTGDEYKELKESVYEKLGRDDWAYLYEAFPGPFRKVCKERMGK